MYAPQTEANDGRVTQHPAYDKAYNVNNDSEDAGYLVISVIDTLGTLHLELEGDVHVQGRSGIKCSRVHLTSEVDCDFYQNKTQSEVTGV